MESILTHQFHDLEETRSTASDALIGHSIATGLCSENVVCCYWALDQHMRCNGHRSMLGSCRFETRPVGH
jgi:hypothetical protein